MAKINTDAIWQSLGSFFDLFPDHERRHWNSFWSNYADVVADVWGLAFQVDKSKSLFSASPVIERLGQDVVLSSLTIKPGTEFNLASLANRGGALVLTGYAPRDKRSTSSVPAEGDVVLGHERVPYTGANVELDENGLVSWCRLTLTRTPNRDYDDVVRPYDSFDLETVTLALRINHVAGATIIDALGQGQVNDSGILAIAGEDLEYESVTVIGSRYIFQLSTSWRPPSTGPQILGFNRVAGDDVVVSIYDTGRWTQVTTGRGMVRSQGLGLDLIVNDQPTSTQSLAKIQSLAKFRANGDFDILAAVAFDTWPDPVAASTQRRAMFTISIGALSWSLGIRTQADSGLAISHDLVSGPTSSMSASPLTQVPARIEFRARRIGGHLILLTRDDGDASFSAVYEADVGGGEAVLSMSVDDSGTGTSSVVKVDEVRRAAGEMALGTRRTSFFRVEDQFPYTYDVDRPVTSSAVLRDGPLVASVDGVLDQGLESPDDRVAKITVADNDYGEKLSPPGAGVLDLGVDKIVYDRVEVVDGVYHLDLRRGLDEDDLPLPAGTTVTASTNELRDGDDYVIKSASGSSTVSFKIQPTATRLWSPECEIDYRHVQKTFGVLTDMDSDVSDEAYVRRVRGAWAALMSGPSVAMFKTAMHLSLALPVASADGIVSHVYEQRDVLGRITDRVLVIDGPAGQFEHHLDPSSYPAINWSVDVGDTVEEFQPLTNGVEIWDEIADGNWHTRFPGVADAERFTSLGVFLAMEAMGPDSSATRARRLANRLKPTYTKLVMRMLLTSGNEDLSDQIHDDIVATAISSVCEDMTWPETPLPPGWDGPWKLGQGYKLGWGGTLGWHGNWHPTTLGSYASQGPFTDGSIAPNTDPTLVQGVLFSAVGAFSFVDDQGADGATSGDVFTSQSAAFTAADVGKTLVLLTGADAGTYTVTEFVSSVSLRVSTAFSLSLTGVTWELRDDGFRSSDVGKNIHVFDATDPADNGDFKITEVIDKTTVRLLKSDFANTETVTWELRDYMSLGENRVLGTFDAYRCQRPSENSPDEILDTRQIFDVAVVA